MNRRPDLVRYAAVFLLLLGFCGCNSDPVEIKRKFDGEYPIDVVCTTGMVADLVRNVGGEHVNVTQLMESDIDPHIYKASPGDMIELNEADLVFYSGLHLEGKMEDILKNQGREKPVVAVAEKIDKEKLLHDEKSAVDPHVWFDVSLWDQARSAVQETLVKFDPKHAVDYKKQGEAYRDELEELHRYARLQMASIPKQQRKLVTAHDAFQYFGRAYGIEVKAIQGISTVDEAGSKRIRELVEYITRNKVKAVFVESTVSEKNIKALIEGCQARGHMVVIGGELYSDAMGPPGTPEGTYLGMVRHNVDTLVKALK